MLADTMDTPEGDIVRRTSHVASILQELCLVSTLLSWFSPLVLVRAFWWELVGSQEREKSAH